MKVLLAGYNLDYDLIRELKEKSAMTQDLTPETISAAYARISRSPRQVFELRQNARAEVEKARQSNRNIVFDMGHSSIAEHAVFNIDVLGVSRLLVEEIEKFRLCSFTEKSQRYVLFDKDFVLPEEIGQAGLTSLFAETIAAQNDYYQQLYQQLSPFVFEQNKELARDSANKSLLEGWAKEDARYVISMATQTQLGMTINTRNLELMLRRLAALPLAEAQEYGQKLYEATKNIAPSLIRYTEATDYDKLTRKNLAQKADIFSRKYAQKTNAKKRSAVNLTYATADADTRIAAAVLFSSSQQSYALCLNQAKRLTARDKKALLKTVFEHLKPYDAVFRELENVDMQFELIVSSSCFAQLKRHRMATIISQQYDPALGVTTPPSVRQIGQQKKFMDIMRLTEKTYEQIRKKAPVAAAYILTNAHRKKVLMKFNAREMYHLARLRADAHAQWDIRKLTEDMLRQAKKKMPLTLLLACGKDSFASLYAKNFRR
ncbi:MAG TPA: FAD-dependent thymidylate synthase [Deltaproteobacteria bacterium]|nr:FAD-dependent thymidylate synthase [Deltaproteobacteria bacterium]